MSPATDTSANFGDKEPLHNRLPSGCTSPFHFLDEDESEYMKLIQRPIRDFFPTFAAAFEEQSPAERERGRCALIDFTPQGCKITSSVDSADLNNSLAGTPSSHNYIPGKAPQRRLFILEDLPCNYILALGSKLRVPPSFFAGHWNDPASSTFNHRNPFQRFSLPQFQIRYAAANQVRVDDHAQSDNGLMRLYAFNTNVSRYFHEFSPKGVAYDEVWSYHVMSFWASQTRGDGSWDAVLLVDPPPEKFVRCLTTWRLIPLRPRWQSESSSHFLNPPLDDNRELSNNPGNWKNQYRKPQYISMFNDIVQFYSSGDFLYSNTVSPLRAVELPRKLVISTMLAYIRGRYLNLVTFQRTQQRPHTLRSNYLCNFSNSSFSSWSDEFFDFMFGACAAMKEFKREVEEDMTALGLDTQSYAAPQWEVDGWKSFRDLTCAVEEMTVAFAANYLSYITIQEAHTSNRSAHSLSKITMLTMLFIPLSTVASIFSMGEEFLPGKARAWVFWAVTVPVLIILALSYWHQKLMKVWYEKQTIFLDSKKKRQI